MKLLLTLLLVAIISCGKDVIGSNKDAIKLTKQEEILLGNLCIDKDQLLEDLSNKEKQKNRSIPAKIEDFTEKEAIIFARRGNLNYVDNYYISIDNKYYISCKLPVEFWKANLKVIISATSYTWYSNDGDRESLPMIISKIKPI